MMSCRNQRAPKFMHETDQKMYCLILSKEFHHGVKQTSEWLPSQHHHVWGSLPSACLNLAEQWRNSVMGPGVELTVNPDINTVSWYLTKVPRQYNVAEIEFPTNSIETIGQPSGKKNLDVDLTLFTKVNSKWITCLNIGCKTRKLLKEYRKKPKWPRLWWWPFEYHTMIHELISWTSSKNFCSGKDSVKRRRRQAIDGGKHLQKTSDKELLSRIYKELLNI